MSNKAFTEMLSEYPVFFSCLDDIIREQQQKSHQSAPLADYQRCASNPQQNSRINRVPHVRVRPSANELMVSLDDNFVTPLLPEMNARPRRNSEAH